MSTRAYPPTVARAGKLAIAIENPVTGAGVLTVIVALADALPDVAVIVDVPAATPITRPVETVATDVLLELHVIGCPVSALPDASSVEAVSCTD